LLVVNAPNPANPNGTVIESDSTNDVATLAADPASILHGSVNPSVQNDDQGKPTRLIATFEPADGALTLAQAAIICGVDHFNWVQTVTPVTPQSGWIPFELHNVLVNNTGAVLEVPDPYHSGHTLTFATGDALVAFDPAGHLIQLDESGMPTNIVDGNLDPGAVLDPLQQVDLRLEPVPLPGRNVQFYIVPAANAYFNPDVLDADGDPYYWNEPITSDDVYNSYAPEFFPTYATDGFALGFGDRPRCPIFPQDNGPAVPSLGPGEYLQFETRRVGVGANGPELFPNNLKVNFNWRDNTLTNGDGMATLPEADSYSGPNDGGTIVSGGVFDVQVDSGTVGTTTTVVSDNSGGSFYGQAVTLTAMVSATNGATGTASGIVDFFDATAQRDLGTGPLQVINGVDQASLSIASLGVGTHDITATYVGDTNFDSSSGSLTQAVSQDATATGLSTLADPGLYGQALTLTATVTAKSPGSGTPTGTVDFFDTTTNTDLGTGTLQLVGGVDQATLTTVGLGVGAHAVTATYGGDGNFSSSSGSLTETVNQDSTGTDVSSSANPSVYGQTVTLTATVGANAPGSGTPTGTVDFFDTTSNTDLGTGTLQLVNAVDQATLTAAGLGVGTHAITATCEGDANFLSSTASLTQTVNQDPTITGLSSSVNPSVYGQAVAFTATVTANAPGSGTPTGTVDFLDTTSNSDLGTGTLQVVNGVNQATLTTAALGVGGHTITATYQGDSNFLSSTASLTQTVNQDSTTTGLSSSVNPSIYGQAVTLTATVTANAPGSGTPTGTVDFFDTATNTDLGSATLQVVNGVDQATLTTAGLGVGAHTITATYKGDGNFLSSNGSLKQTVNQDATTTTLSSSANPSLYGAAVTFTATVTANAPGSGTPTGTVDFFDTTTNTDLGTGTLQVVTGVNQATLSSAALGVGANAITATYKGDTNFLSSTTASPLVQKAKAGMILLDSTGRGALTDSGKGSVVVNGGSVVVDSSNAAAVVVSGNGSITAPLYDLVTGAGISITGKGQVVGQVQGGQTATADPLAGLAPPDPTTLSVQSNSTLKISGKQVVTLNPGEYIGGIQISGQAQVTLNPGVYYFKGGGFSVSGNASVTDLGQGVLLYNAPASSGDTISISGKGSVSLSAITSGPYQGLTIFQDRNSTTAISITGNGSTVISGTIYAAKATLSITGNGGLDSKGNPLDQIGSLLLVADLSISGNGSFRVDATS
jgi:hypothetical protein